MSEQRRVIQLVQDRLEDGNAELHVILRADGTRRIELTSIVLQDDLDAEHVIGWMQRVMPFLSGDADIDDV